MVKIMKHPNPWRIKPATFLTVVQCLNQLHRRVPYERIVAFPTTRVSKTLFWGAVNYSRIFAFFCEGSWINPCKKRGMSVHVWYCGLVTRRSIRTWNIQNGKAYFSGIASKDETSKSEAAPKPLLLQHTVTPACAMFLSLLTACSVALYHKCLWKTDTKKRKLISGFRRNLRSSWMLLSV